MRAPPHRPIGELVERVQTWDPTREASGSEFVYVDLSAVDQDTKRITGTKRLQCEDAPSRARQLVNTGDVLVSTVRPNLNGVALVTDKLQGATASTGFCVLRAATQYLDRNYLFHWVKSSSFVAEMTRLATGASYPAVSDRIIHESRIPLPPLVEQKRIAGILDHADALRALRRDALAKLDALPAAIFADMFGDPVTNPKGWAREALSELVDPNRPITYGILKPGDYTPDGIPMLRIQDIQFGTVQTSNLHKVSRPLSNQYKRTVLQGGELVISLVGTVGLVARVPYVLAGANLHRNLGMVVPNNRVHPVYLEKSLALPHFLHSISQQIRGGNQQLLNLGELSTAPVLVPPLALQEEFARRVAAVEQLRSAHRAALAKLDALFAALQHRAFRGEL